MAPRSRFFTRRSFLQSTAAIGAGGALVLAGHADDTPPPLVEADLITADTQSAIDRGLAYLAATQASDGSFPDTRTMFGNVAITGLAGLALMAGGHQPGRGRFGSMVARAADYVATRGATSNPPGYLNNADTLLAHGAMYQHGFGALFLSEAHGMLTDPAKQKRIRDVLEKAIALSIKAQNRDGGWRYEPQPPVLADVSVTVAQLMALRAAKNAGIFVPKTAVDKAVQYIKACQLPDGGFCYIKSQGYVGSAFARSAAALVGLFCAGIYEGKEIERGLNYLMRFIPGRRVAVNEPRGAEHYFYGHYYAALAMWTAGGNYWAEWFPAIRDELVAKSRTGQGGVWNDWHGPAYATAMSCIVLQLPNNYLPIMQK